MGTPGEGMGEGRGGLGVEKRARRVGEDPGVAAPPPCRASPQSWLTAVPSRPHIPPAPAYCVRPAAAATHARHSPPPN